MTFIKKVINADAGTADLVGGNNWDTLDDYHDDVATGLIAKINTETRFRSDMLKIRGSDNLFQYQIRGSALAANQTLQLPLITGTDTLSALGVAQTFSEAQSIKKNVSDLFTLYRDSSTVNDSWGVLFDGKNSLAAQVSYARIRSEIITNTSAAEVGRLKFSVSQAGSLTEVGRFTELGKFRCGGPSLRVEFDETGLSATRTFTFPNLTTQLAGLSATQTFTEENTFKKDASYLITLYRDSNVLTNYMDLKFDFKNASNAQINYGFLRTTIVDNTAGSEDAAMYLGLVIAGAEQRTFEINELGETRLGGSNRRVRLAETGLTAGRNFTFPNANSLLFGDGVDNNLGDHYLDVGDIAAPANPAAGIRRLFNNTATGELSVRTSAGTTVSLESGGGGGGEANTASNVGAGGVGVFKQKTGVNLEFKNLNVVSTSRLTVTDDTGSSEVDLDIPSNAITDALVNAHTSTKITITAKGQLNSAIVYNDQANIFGDFDQTFKDNRLLIENPAGTFKYTIIGAAIAANRNLNLPLITGSDTLASLGLSQTFTKNQNISEDTTRLLKLYRPTTNVAGTAVELSFRLDDSTAAEQEYSKLRAEIVTNTDTLEDSVLEFYIQKAGTNTRVLQLHQSGDVLMGPNIRMRFAETGLSATRTFTFPNVTTMLAGLDNAQTFSLINTFTKSVVLNGGMNVTHVAKTANYTLTADDGIIRADASAGAFTLTLPAAASNTKKIYSIIRTDVTASSNMLTIDGNASETIDGNLTYLMVPGESLTILCDGSNWVVLSRSDVSAQSGYAFLKNSTNNRRYVAGLGSGNNPLLTSTTTPAVNTLWAMPFFVSKVTKFDTISFEVTTLIAAKNARCGIYSDNGNCYPGALIFDTGSVSVATTGVKDTTITASLQILQPGLYWLTWETDSTVTLQIRILPGAGACIGIAGLASTMGTTGAGFAYSVAHTYGALPNPYTASATLITTPSAVGAPIPAVALRAI